METYKVDVRRYFVETGRVNSKGKPVRIPVTVRKLYLYGKFLFPTTAKYRIVRTNRRGEVRYSVSYMPIAERPWWEKAPAVEPDTKWRKLDRAKGDGSFSETEFLTWLARKFGGLPGMNRAWDIKRELDESMPVAEAA